MEWGKTEVVGGKRVSVPPDMEWPGNEPLSLRWYCKYKNNAKGNMLYMSDCHTQSSNL